MRGLRSLTLCAITFCGLGSSAAAGDKLVLLEDIHLFEAISDGDDFGLSVSGAGDVNGDGRADLIVGAPEEMNTGVAYVFSGLDGSILHRFGGKSADDRFGISVSSAGDVNKDGYDDVIVGADADDTNGLDAGSATVFSGFDGRVLHRFFGNDPSDRFGFSVSGAGDVNNDLYADVIVGAAFDDDNGLSSGSARVLSGRTGAVIHEFFGDSAGDRFGRAVSDAGDVNNDGFADLLVGAFGDDNAGNLSGSARVLCGLTGTALYTFDGTTSSDQFGRAVSGAGDVNNDGYADLIVGAQFDDNDGSFTGSARVLSGFDGSELYTFEGDFFNDRLGISVSGIGDINNDNHDDLLVGADGVDTAGDLAGAAYIYSGATGDRLAVISGLGSGDAFGTSVSCAGDVTGDGVPDVIVGAPMGGATGGGYARVVGLPGPPDACNPADINSASSPSPAFPEFGIPDGVITPNDFAAFSFFFQAGDLRADINSATAPTPQFIGFGVPDGVLTPSDFTAFTLYFEAGCPCTLPGCPAD